MNYAVEMASCDMMYVPDFVKISSGVQQLLRSTHIHRGDFVSLLKFFKIKKVGKRNNFWTISENGFCFCYFDNKIA
jgi:hypothetical protein